jgi:hypothetical protein
MCTDQLPAGPTPILIRMGLLQFNPCEAIERPKTVRASRAG